MRQETGLQVAGIAKKVAEVDLRDGNRDGRMMAKPVSCAKCSRPTPTRQRTCIFCAAPVEQGHIVEKPANP